MQPPGFSAGSAQQDLRNTGAQQALSTRPGVGMQPPGFSDGSAQQDLRIAGAQQASGWQQNIITTITIGGGSGAYGGIPQSGVWPQSGASEPLIIIPLGVDRGYTVGYRRLAAGDSQEILEEERDHTVGLLSIRRVMAWVHMEDSSISSGNIIILKMPVIQTGQCRSRLHFKAGLSALAIRPSWDSIRRS